MKNLLKIISALVLIIMSEQAFATNNQHIEDQDSTISMLRTAGVSEEEIAIAMSLQDNNNNQSSSSTVPTPSPASLIDLTSSSTSTSYTTKAEVIAEEVRPEEAKQTAFISLKDLKPQSENHNIFERVHTNVVGKLVELTGSKSKDYSIIHWINKEKDNRLYNFLCWINFNKKGFAHDPVDINMVSTEEQYSLAPAIYYQAFYQNTGIEIIEFKAFKDPNGRTVDQLISAMSHKNTNNIQSSNFSQSIVHSFMNWKKG